jgi:hypothetical protein
MEALESLLAEVGSVVVSGEEHRGANTVVVSHRREVGGGRGEHRLKSRQRSHPHCVHCCRGLARGIKPDGCVDHDLPSRLGNSQQLHLRLALQDGRACRLCRRAHLELCLFLQDTRTTHATGPGGVKCRRGAPTLPPVDNSIMPTLGQSKGVQSNTPLRRPGLPRWRASARVLASHGLLQHPWRRRRRQWWRHRVQ